MEILIEIINYLLASILIGVSISWIILIRSMVFGFENTPYLDKFNFKSHNNPKVSIILPARNEQKFISKCLDSLLNQDYSNYEVIAIDDSSTDNTGKIIENYSMNNSKIIKVSARPKPDDWLGKNWACMEGYQKASGELLLFTDSDTKFSKNLISLAVGHLLAFNLDALTVIPKMLCLDKWTRITLPMLSTFLHTRFSAIRVNDPTKKTGYFFGSFYIIKKEIYEKIGTHQGVKQEIIEDGALGKKVKESGYKLKMVRGEHLLEAVWARNWDTLWNGLKRLMVPLYLQYNKVAIGIFFAVLFLLLMPFPIMIYSVIFFGYNESYFPLFISSIIACCLIYLAGILDSTRGLHLKWTSSIASPVGSFIVVSGFLAGIIHAKRSSAVSWRDRNYSSRELQRNSISI